jgi:cobalamin synthase
MKTNSIGKIAAIAIAAVTALPVSALARPDTRTMSCAAAQALVRNQGAIVMTTGQYTYERIVANRSFCDWDEDTWIKIAPTLDNPKCRVGSYCRARINDGDGPLRRFRN